MLLLFFTTSMCLVSTTGSSPPAVRSVDAAAVLSPETIPKIIPANVKNDQNNNEIRIPEKSPRAEGCEPARPKTPDVVNHQEDEEAILRHGQLRRQQQRNNNTGIEFDPN